MSGPKKPAKPIVPFKPNEDLSEAVSSALSDARETSRLATYLLKQATKKHLQKITGYKQWKNNTGHDVKRPTRKMKQAEDLDDVIFDKLTHIINKLSPTVMSYGNLVLQLRKVQKEVGDENSLENLKLILAQADEPENPTTGVRVKTDDPEIEENPQDLLLPPTPATIKKSIKELQLENSLNIPGSLRNILDIPETEEYETDTSEDEEEDMDENEHEEPWSD